MVEHWTENPCVSGSNPLLNIYIANIELIGKWFAFQAKVMGSSPFIRIISLFYINYKKKMKSVYYLTFYSYCGKSLDNIINAFKKIFQKIKIVQLPKKKSKFVVIKSPHVFNKSREHFETIVFKKLVCIVLNTKNKNIFNNLLKGIYWSMFGLSLKKVKLSKKCYYL